MSAAGSAFDVGIVGAGPAGLAAAIQAAELGLRVALFDEQAEPGGQIYRGIERATDATRRILGADYERGGALVGRFRDSGAAYFPRATVAYVSDDLALAVARDERLETFSCRMLIAATGALERPFPVRGWTLPGVFAAGGVQALLKGSALVPAGRVAIAGTGPLAYLIGSQLLAAGVRDLVFLDTTPPANYPAAALRIAGAFGRTDYLFKGIELLRGVRSGAARYVPYVRHLEARGERAVTAVRYATPRGQEERAVDALVLHQGVVPNTQLTGALGLTHYWSSQQLCWHPVLDEWFRTSRSDVLVAGDSAGILGAEAAEDTGTLAALQAATALGRLSESARDAHAKAPRGRLQRLTRVRAFLDRLYRPAVHFRIPARETIVCRCEDVTVAEACAAIDEGCLRPDELKFSTRCGMGPCQGRYCGLTVTELIARQTRRAPADVGYYTLRQPLKPVKLGLLATAATAIAKAVPYKT